MKEITDKLNESNSQINISHFHNGPGIQIKNQKILAGGITK